MNQLLEYNLDHPASIRIDICTMCQLHCKGCHVNRTDSGCGCGFLSFEKFKKICEKNPFVKWIELSNLGEVFLHPELLKIMEYAYDKDIKLNAYNGCNFNTVSDAVLEGLVKYKFNSITLSIDGSSQETYSQYRIGGNFFKVIENINKLNMYKEKYHSDFPFLNWQYILLQKNSQVEEVKRAVDYARVFRMGCITFKKDWDGFIPENLKDLEKEIGNLYSSASSSHELSLKYKTYSEMSYSQVYTSVWKRKQLARPLLDLGYSMCANLFCVPVFNWDGRLKGCCHSCSWFPANLFDNDYSITKTLQSDCFQRTRLMLMNKLPSQNDTFCSRCSCYLKMCKDKKFVEESFFENVYSKK